MVARQKTYNLGSKYRRRLSTPLALGLGLILGAALLTGSYFLFIYRATPNVIPTVIKKQISFVIFYPNPNPAIIVDAQSFKYDEREKLLSYVVQYANRSVTIAEQATPQNFIDIPESYDKLIESLGEYASFDSFYDKVSLTHPKEFNGQQSAVMNSKGTLFFAHPTNGDLTEDQWKKLFNNLEVIR